MAQYLTTGAAYKLGVGREIAREVVTPRLRLGLPTGCARCLVSDLTCGRCSKVNLAVLLQDTARERLGRQHRTPAAGAAPRQHQEQGPGVRGAGDADSGARDDLRVLQAEPTGAQRPDRPGAAQRERSEEHTSELQSPYDLVCRLLLEKKKNNKTISCLCSLPDRSTQPLPARAGPPTRSRPQTPLGPNTEHGSWRA